MCEISFDEGASVWKESEHTARKQHRCDCCRGVIRPGERYTKTFWIGDGRACSEKSCAPCALVTREFDEEHDAVGCPSYMRTLLEGCVQEESDVGNVAMVDKWQAALDSMWERRRAAEAVA